MNAKYAVVRGVADTYDRCIRPPGSTESIDVGRAREQHAAYCSELSRLGLELIVLEADDRYPDCCFVEDPVVVIGDKAIFTPMQAETRRGESTAIREALSRYKEIGDISAPATLDGGDVVQVNGKLFVGLTRRSNSAAIDQLREMLGEEAVVPVPVNGVLHFKSACSYVGRDAILVSPQHLDTAPLSHMEMVDVPIEETYAANCLAVGNTVLLPAGYPRTSDLVARRGFDVVELEMSEFRKGWGSLTCLSILF